MAWTNRISGESPSLWPALATDFRSKLPFPPQLRLGRSRLGRLLPDASLVRPIGQGDRVRISQGVFSGVEGTVLDVRKGRVIIAVEILEPGVTVEIDAAMVQPLETYRRLSFPH